MTIVWLRFWVWKVMYINGVYSTKRHQSLLEYPSNINIYLSAILTSIWKMKKNRPRWRYERSYPPKNAYNRLKLVQRHMIRMDMIAKSKSPLIDANRMRWVILTTTAPVMYILKDLGEFLEILNQQQVQKEKKVAI